VTAIVEQLCGFSVSSAVVSRAATLLDETLESWRNRALGEFPYVFLDARYEKVRQDGQIRDAAILIAVGVGLDGKRQILGVSVSLSEHEVHWRIFLQSLVARGLNSVQLITSDDHAGLKAARIAVFSGVPWQPPSRTGTVRGLSIPPPAKCWRSRAQTGNAPRSR
jgi:transposase-like protein